MLNEQAWDDWVLHRREIGHSIKPGTVTEKKNKNELLKYTYDQQQFIVDWAIDKGWRGLYSQSAMKHYQEAGFIERQSNTSWADDIGTFHDTNVRSIERK